MLIGRETELTAVLGWIEHAIRPTENSTDTAIPIHCIEIDGAIGVGKSTLAGAVIARLICDETLPADAHVINCRGSQAARLSLLSAVQPLLSELLQTNRESLLENAHLGRIARDLQTTLDAAPLVVVLDDVQWFDSASIELLRLFLRRPGRTPRTMIMIHRPRQSPHELLREARTLGARLESLTLESLPDDAIRAMAAGVSADQQDLIVATAGGNPLFASALSSFFQRFTTAQSLEEALGHARLHSTSLLQNILKADVDSLPPPTRQVLFAIAVLDSRAPTEVASILDGDVQAVSAECEVLIDHGLLDRETRIPIHPLISQSALACADEEAVRQLHRRAAHLPDRSLLAQAHHLAALGPSATAEEITRLLLAAESVIGSDPSTVAKWLAPVVSASSVLQSSDQVRAEVLLSEAEILSGQALAAVERLRALCSPTIASTHAAVGREAEGSLGELLDRARVMLARGLRMLGDAGTAIDVLAVDFDGAGPALVMEHAALNALTDSPIPDHLCARLAAREEIRYRAAGTSFSVISELAQGDVHAARARFSGLIPTLLGLPHDEIIEILDACGAAAWAAYLLDEHRGAIDLASSGLRIARRFGHADVSANLGTSLAFSLVTQGRFTEAEVAAEEAIEDANRYDTLDFIGMALCALAQSAQWQRDDVSLDRILARLVKAPTPTIAWWRRTVDSNLARLQALRGIDPTATPQLLPHDASAGFRYADAAVVALCRDQTAEAVDLLTEGRVLARRLGLMSQEGHIVTMLAEIQLGSGAGIDRALTLCADAITLCDTLHVPPLTARARAAHDAATNALPHPRVGALTQREREIAGMVARYMTNQQIADELYISRRTAEEHVSHILKKLDLNSRYRLREFFD